MKKLKVGLMALSLIAGGMCAASAATTPSPGSRADILIDYGSNAPNIFFVNGVPLPTNGVVETQFDSTETDGAGKVDGAVALRISFTSGSDTNLTETAHADITASVTGSIVTKGSTVTANISIKGNGFSSDGTNSGDASVSLKFVG